MTSCSKVEEKTGKEDGRQKNSLVEIDKTLATLKTIPIRLHWGKILSLPDETCQHMVAALKHPKLFADKVNWVVLRENGVLPVSKMTKAPLPGITTSSRGLLREENNLLTAHTTDGFDPDPYKLMEELRYNFPKLLSLGQVIEAKPYGANDTQKMIRRQGGGLLTPRLGLSDEPSRAVKISRWHKDKQSLIQ